MTATDRRTGTYVALDVGGTSIKGAVFDEGLHPVLERRLPWGSAKHPQTVLDFVDELAASADKAGYEVRAVGVVVPGIVDQRRGVAIEAANLPWRDVPLRSLVEQHTGLPVAFGHDVRAGGLAELRLGAARGATDALILPVGTGIAAAMIRDGKLIEGSRVGEIGHLFVDSGLVCACGAVGCLETVASAAAVTRRYAASAGRTPAGGASGVVEALRAGDPVAQAVWEDALRALAQALACYITLLDPDLIVVGGGLAQAGETLLVPLGVRLRERLSFQRMPQLRAAALGDLAGCIGAGLLAADLVGASPDRSS